MYVNKYTQICKVNHWKNAGHFSLFVEIQDHYKHAVGMRERQANIPPWETHS